MLEWYQTMHDSLWLKPDDTGGDEAIFIKRALRLRKGQTVLDAPCGAGRIAIHLARLGCQVTGFDLRATFLRRARRRFKEARLQGTFIQGDLRDLDLDPHHRLVVLPPTVTREHIVVMARPLSANQPFKAYVLGAAGGNVLEEIDLVGEAEDREVLTIRWQLIGQPVVTNGRLLVETCEGVTVYGGR